MPRPSKVTFMMEDTAFNFGSAAMNSVSAHDGDVKSKKIVSSPKVSSLKPPPEIEELSDKQQAASHVSSQAIMT
jgi:hypothetical protein